METILRPIDIPCSSGLAPTRRFSEYRRKTGGARVSPPPSPRPGAGEIREKTIGIYVPIRHIRQIIYLLGFSEPGDPKWD